MNVEQLREALSEQITLLRSGKAEPKNVNALVNAAGKIISTVRLELEYAKMIGAVPRSQFLLAGNGKTKALK